VSRQDDELEGRDEPASLPRYRVGTGHATDEQWSAVNRWARRYRREHRHEDPYKRFDQAEIEDEERRWGKS